MVINEKSSLVCVWTKLTGDDSALAGAPEFVAAGAPELLAPLLNAEAATLGMLTGSPTALHSCIGRQIKEKGWTVSKERHFFQHGLRRGQATYLLTKSDTSAGISS